MVTGSKRRVRALFVLPVVLCAALAWAPEGGAQAKLRRVGVIANVHSDPLLESFEQGLASRGWIKGKTVAVEYRITGGNASRMAEAAAELVRLNVDVICAWSAPALREAYVASRTIPIVAVDYTTDPVTAGYAESYGHPGRNVTGVFLDAPGFTAKWLESLKAIVPGLSRVGVIWDPAPGTVHFRAVQGAALSLDIEVQVLQVHKPEDIEPAFASLRQRVQAAILLPSPMLYVNNRFMGELALKHRLLATSMFREFADAGGALSYGPYQPAHIERSGMMVANILNGAKPADLPIDRPSKFEFVVNLKTLKTLGLSVPDSVLLRADEVIR
jgi:putative ABC transport system substrate-binding protein